MSDVAITVENLGKSYRIGAGPRHDTLRDAVAARLRRRRDRGSRTIDDRSPGGLSPSAQSSGSETFWALRDVSFEVKSGEVMGVIGRNGAGKSTLLKILSRITEPTTGQAVIRGRVGSLLEVGTGFHPELTGRENIYLNGAILGMHRSEIDRRFDEIVAFSEIERFLDTPVKRYSSGMYVRLAFAVAAHLDPEVLIVDEVLAVGDAAFQKKCLGKMGDVAGEGRTVLFVSHNMAAVQNLCGWCLLLREGVAVAQGNTAEVISQYMDDGRARAGRSLGSIAPRVSAGRLRLTTLDLLDGDGNDVSSFVCGDSVSLVMGFIAKGAISCSSAVFSLAFYDQFGRSLFLCRSDFTGRDYTHLPAHGSVACTVPKLPLPAGRYFVNLYCEVNGRVEYWVESARAIDVEQGDYYGSGRLPAPERGDLLVPHEWSEPISAPEDLAHA
ncbi:MAG: ABC transporter ATP-binding protein [Chloroflexi bacterium]|nr:ABC transporter ATP-binding protein [Chloroflexota bacterium]